MPFLPRPMKLEGMVGDKGFDPLGLSEWVPVDWLRESELKHGRVCMLASWGSSQLIWVSACLVRCTR